MLKANMQGAQLSISSTISHAEKNYPDTEVVSRLVSGEVEHSTWASVAARARRAASALQRLGVEPGDRVGTLAWNTARHLEVYFAISGMGAVLHTVNPRLFEAQLTYIINHAKDKYLCADLSFVELLHKIRPQLTEVVNVILLCKQNEMPQDCKDAGWLCFEDLLEAEDDSFEWPAVDENQAASLCYTSGTTGNPKGVLYSHRSTLLHSWSFATKDCLSLGSGDIVLPVVPMFHVNAWGVPYAAAMMGAKLVLPGPHLDGASLHQMIESEKVEILMGVPTVWLGLLNQLREVDAVLDKVHTVVVGGSAAPISMIKEFDERHNAFLLHAWGMTEMSPIGTANVLTAEMKKMPAEQRHKLQTKQGKAVYGCEMRIADDEGKTLPNDGKTFGRLLVRGPWIVERYYLANEPAVDEEGWFDTGDVSTIDSAGYMQIVDRAKDVIKSGGEWISSIDLENSAVGHPDVVEACVVGVPHPKWDERPLLFVIRQEGSTLDKETMLAFLSDKIVKWWMPDDVIFVGELPHTATGKLLKTGLREQYNHHLMNT